MGSVVDGDGWFLGQFGKGLAWFAAQRVDYAAPASECRYGKWWVGSW